MNIFGFLFIVVFGLCGCIFLMFGFMGLGAWSNGRDQMGKVEKEVHKKFLFKQFRLGIISVIVLVASFYIFFVFEI